MKHLQVQTYIQTHNPIEGLAHKEIKEASQKLSSSKCCLRDLYTFPEESDEDETHEEQLIILTQETQKLAISQFDHEQAVLSQKTIPQSPIHSMETRSTDTSQHSEATKPNIFLNKYGDKFFNCILGSQTNKKVSPPTSQALFGDNEQSQNITYFNKIYRLTQNDKKLNKTKPNNLDSQVPRNMNSRRIKVFAFILSIKFRKHP